MRIIFTSLLVLVPTVTYLGAKGRLPGQKEYEAQLLKIDDVLAHPFTKPREVPGVKVFVGLSSNNFPEDASGTFTVSVRLDSDLREAWDVAKLTPVKIAPDGKELPQTAFRLDREIEHFDEMLQVSYHVPNVTLADNTKYRLEFYLWPKAVPREKAARKQSTDESAKIEAIRARQEHDVKRIKLHKEEVFRVTAKPD